jgi:VanZ family protein
MGRIIKSSLFWGYWFPVVVYCGVIFAQSAYPSPDSLSSYPFGDKMMHFLAYALLGGLFFRALNKSFPHWCVSMIALLSVLLTTLYGVSDEIHQSFVAARTAEGMDILADFAGGAFGAIVFALACLLAKQTDGGMSD